MMRTIYLGHNPGYASACYEESDLLAVFWHGGEGNLATRTEEMLDYCRDRKIVTVHHGKLDDVVKGMIASLELDLIVIGEYHFILKNDVIQLPGCGTINLHGAPLPRYRGAHPINWMIINGETEGAVTCHYVTEGIDNGDIIGQYTFPILDAETAYDVRPKIEATGRRLLTDVIRRFRDEGKVPGTPQDERLALYTPPRKPEDGLIDWGLPPKRLYDFVRALARPYPGAFTRCRGEKVYVWRIEPPAPTSSRAIDGVKPGTVLEKNGGYVTVAVREGTVTITDWEGEINLNDCLS